MRFITFLILIFLFAKRNISDKSTKIIYKHEVPQRAYLSKNSKIFLGNRLFFLKYVLLVTLLI